MEGDAGTSRLTPPEDDDVAASDVIDDIAATTEDSDTTSSTGPADTTGTATEGTSDLESSTSDDDSATDVPSADEAAGAPNLLDSRIWARRIIAAMVAACVLLIGAGALLLWLNHKAGTARANEAMAVQAAKDCVIATQAPNLKAMQESQQKIMNCGTGDFGAQAALYSGVLVDAYRAANAQVEVETIRAAPERTNDDGSIDVLVAMRVKTSNSVQQDQPANFRLRVKMAPDGGVYKIAKLDQVSK